MRPRPASLLAIVLALGISSQLRAGPPGASQSNPPVYKTQTREVVVDVVVTKGNNDPVGGLHANDFVVMEDSKPQTVNFFEEHSIRKLPDELKPLPMPPGVYTNVPPAPESDSVNVLLLDTLNTDPPDQAYVRQQMLNFLKTMEPGLRVAVFVLGANLRMVQGFTTDSSVLRDAVNNKKNGISMETDTAVTRTLQNKFEDIEDMSRLAAMQMSAVGLEALASQQANFAGYQADQRVAMTLEALNDLGRYLAGVPGRKNLIWFSSSFPVTVFPSPKEKQSFSPIREYSAKLKETADLLTVSKVAVYPISSEGMMMDHGSDGVIQSNGVVDVEGGEVNGRSGAIPSGRPVAFMTPFTNENASHADKIMAMEQLAADTGGKAFYNTNDLNAAMMHAIENGSHYYTLVYTPTNKKMDGSYRRIEIKLAEDKYKLAYRRGYNADDSLALDQKPDTKVPDTDPLHSLMQPGLPGATQIIYAVRAVPADPQPTANAPRAGKNAKLTGPTKRYNVDFLIRSSDVRLESNSDGDHTGKLRIELLAFDREGHAFNAVSGTNFLNLTPDLYAAIQRSGIRAHFEIDLPANSQALLETGVYDWATGKVGTLEVPLRSVSSTTASTSPTPPKTN